MTQTNMHEAKTNLSKLIQQALNGEEVIIANNGTPLVKLIPIAPASKGDRPLGQWKGQVWVADDFDQTPEEIIRLFEGDDNPSTT